MNLKQGIKKQVPHGLWRALRDLRQELSLLRRHRKGASSARKYDNSNSLRLNIGCGQNVKAGWVNIDIAGNVDLQLDLREPLPFLDHSAHIIYSEHFFEHLDYPEDANRFLSECFRLLEPGGIFSVAVPDTRWPLLDYANADDGKYFQAAKEQRWHPEWCKTRMEHINYHFRQDNEHRFAYDFETMEKALKDAGFVEIGQREFDPNLDTKTRALGTLYVNALKP